MQAGDFVISIIKVKSPILIQLNGKMKFFSTFLNKGRTKPLRNIENKIINEKYNLVICGI